MVKRYQSTLHAAVMFAVKRWWLLAPPPRPVTACGHAATHGKHPVPWWTWRWQGDLHDGEAGGSGGKCRTTDGTRGGTINDNQDGRRTGLQFCYSGLVGNPSNLYLFGVPLERGTQRWTVASPSSSALHVEAFSEWVSCFDCNSATIRDGFPYRARLPAEASTAAACQVTEPAWTMYLHKFQARLPRRIAPILCLSCTTPIWHLCQNVSNHE